MGIQTTVQLTRIEAESKLRAKRAREADVMALTDEEIEGELDERFYNYQIIEE